MYKHGDFYVTCPITGFVHLRSEMRYRWDGLLVHHSQWNPRQPQDKIPLRRERVYTNLGIGEDVGPANGATYNPSGL